MKLSFIGWIFCFSVFFFSNNGHFAITWNTKIENKWNTLTEFCNHPNRIYHRFLLFERRIETQSIHFVVDGVLGIIVLAFMFCLFSNRFHDYGFTLAGPTVSHIDAGNFPLSTPTNDTSKERKKEIVKSRRKKLFLPNELSMKELCYLKSLARTLNEKCVFQLSRRK